MIVYQIWCNLLFGYVLWSRYTSVTRITICIILSILALPLDIILLPFELIGLIIYLIINKRL